MRSFSLFGNDFWCEYDTHTIQNGSNGHYVVYARNEKCETRFNPWTIKNACSKWNRYWPAGHSLWDTPRQLQSMMMTCDKLVCSFFSLLFLLHNWMLFLAYFMHTRLIQHDAWPFHRDFYRSYIKVKLYDSIKYSVVCRFIFLYVSKMSI